MVKNIEYDNTIDVKDVENDEEENNNISDNEVISFPANYSLPEISRKLEEGTFYRPTFQRNFIWDVSRRSKFIESLFFSYPVPPIFLYKKPKVEKYMIIDGLQRVNAIYSFFKNEFSLKNVSTEIENCTFEELTEEYKKIFEDKQLNCIIIRQLVPNKEEVLYNIFERLNTGGQNLNNMEVRRAIYYGKLIKSLEEINEDENWGRILGRKHIHERFLDVELILRILAFSEKWDNKTESVSDYTKTIKPFLNQYTSENKDNDIVCFKEKFLKITKQIIEDLGDKPFNLYSKPNYVLLDSIMTALLIQKNTVVDLKNKKEKLIKDVDFKEIYEAKQGSLSSKNVNNRIKIALEFLK